ncbi:phage tail-collar fiber domain-containing protein [Enterobacter huaxiensis]|uniref:phage tail-collar fiber domain-containing protein n=1 Tax=Enterobacter huaxiensis TaxID=2494702 RepID=UPI001F38174F|nr:phage tail protein [Enterobacter huaxiensis]
MAEKYYSILTNRGKELEAESSATGKPVIIKDFVVGDGSGQAVRPDPAQIKLVREVYRNAISALQVSPDQANQVIAQLVLPVGVGGFVVREVGLLTDAGELYSVANSAAIEKPENGVSVNLQYRLAVSETANIELKVATGDGLFLRIDKNLSEISAKGEAAQKSSRESIGILDATTSRKGLVELSSATDSSSESVAATSKAVKAAYDLAKGKYTAQDATTAQKGIVQLSSATDSVSEALAATPKAVKAANDNANGRVPSGRKINGHDLTRDTNVTAQDIFNGQAVGIGNAEDLNAYSTPGLYYQPANAQAQTGKNYPEANAGSLEVYKHAGITQIYRIYNSSRAYIRTLYSGTWSAWAKQYDTANKPTAGDVSALPITGGTVTGNAAVNGTLSVGNGRKFEISSQNSSTSNGALLLWGNADRPTVFEFKDTTGYHYYSQRNKDGSVSFSFNGVSSFAGGVTSSGEFVSRSANGFRIAYGNYGAFWRNDGGSLYLLVTNSGDSLGTFNSLRPFTVSLANGDITINKLTLANYASFDARYYTKAQSDAGYMSKTGAYTKAESDSRFQPKGNYTPTGTAYTKAESDGRYYTKAQTDARYQQDTRLGARNYQLMARGKMYETGGNVITGLQISGQVDGDGDYIVMRPLQKQVNGTWYTVAQV